MYTITRQKDGLHLLCEAETRKGIVSESPAGKFDSGNASKETKALALAIATHYFGASPSDLPATAEAQRRAEPLMYAFLSHHKLPVGAKLELSSEVIDRFFSLSSS